MLNVTAKDCSLGAILALDGLLSAKTSQDLVQAVVQQAPKTPKYLIFDFSQLQHVTAAGLRTLYKIHLMTRSDCELIFCETREMTEKMFSTVGFPKVIKFHESVAAAESEIESWEKNQQEE